MKQAQAQEKVQTRAGFINAFPLGRHVPQGLKPAFFRALNGTAEAVPYPKPIYETSSKTQVALQPTSADDNYKRLSGNDSAGDSVFVGSRPGLLYELAAQMKSANMP
ncbi:MAG: hypothetical protein ABR920_05105 [Terriglobales bacterium]|jgi:hypothetical protein